MANTIFLSLAFLDWRHHIGAMAQFWRQPKYPKCVPDCYKNLHFRPLLISMHKRSINLIEGYTRNAFLVFEWRLLIVICADLALLWRNSIWQKNCISQYISLVPLYWKLVIPFKWTWFFKCLWHELWNIVYKTPGWERPTTRSILCSSTTLITFLLSLIYLENIWHVCPASAGRLNPDENEEISQRDVTRETPLDLMTCGKLKDVRTARGL